MAAEVKFDRGMCVHDCALRGAKTSGKKHAKMDISTLFRMHTRIIHIDSGPLNISEH
jgi:hypothetical protein